MRSAFRRERTAVASCPCVGTFAALLLSLFATQVAGLFTAAVARAEEVIAARLVSDPARSAREPDIATVGSAVVLAYVDEESLLLSVVDADAGKPLVGGPSRPRLPKLVVDPLGKVSLLWAASSAATGDATALWSVTHQGGVFSAPSEVAAGVPEPSEEGIARHGIVLGRTGSPMLWWGDSAGTINVLRGLDAEPVAEGTALDVAKTPAGYSHLVYARGGQAYWRTDSEGLDFGPEVPIAGASGVRDISVAPGPDGGAIVALEDSWGVRLVTISSGVPSAPAPFVEGASWPRLRAGADGALALAYLRDGDVYLARRGAGEGEFGPAARAVPEGETGASSGAAVTIDAEGGAHLVFAAGGGVHYGSDVPPPEPRFDVSPRQVSVGEEVVFEDRSVGRISAWRWSFGDGATSTEPQPVHRYLEPGVYTPSLSVTGPGGTRSASIDGEISVEPAANELRMPTVRAPAGASGLLVPVYLTSSVPIGGFEVVLASSAEIVLGGSTVVGTRSESLEVEFFRSELLAGPDGPVLAVGALWDYAPPLDGRVLDPGSDLVLAFVELSVSAEAVEGQEAQIRFLRKFGPLQKSTLLVAPEGAYSIDPFTPDAAVIVAGSAEVSFLRGDANRDESLDISDAVFILDFLFLGGEEILCPDAGDANDDGDLDISDAIAILDVLFLASGQALPYPYPEPGLDGSWDSLGSCLPAD